MNAPGMQLDRKHGAADPRLCRGGETNEESEVRHGYY